MSSEMNQSASGSVAATTGPSTSVPAVDGKLLPPRTSRPRSPASAASPAGVPRSQSRRQKRSEAKLESEQEIARLRASLQEVQAELQRSRVVNDTDSDEEEEEPEGDFGPQEEEKSFGEKTTYWALRICGCADVLDVVARVVLCIALWRAWWLLAICAVQTWHRPVASDVEIRWRLPALRLSMALLYVLASFLVSFGLVWLDRVVEAYVGALELPWHERALLLFRPKYAALPVNWAIAAGWAEYVLTCDPTLLYVGFVLISSFSPYLVRVAAKSLAQLVADYVKAFPQVDEDFLSHAVLRLMGRNLARLDQSVFMSQMRDWLAKERKDLTEHERLERLSSLCDFLRRTDVGFGYASSLDSDAFVSSVATSAAMTHGRFPSGRVFPTDE